MCIARPKPPGAVFHGTTPRRVAADSAQFILLYPRQGEKGPDRAAYVLSKQTLAQQGLAKALKLDELQITTVGNTNWTL
jgi:hypothetical protein